MEKIFADPTFWVAISFLIFAILAFKPVARQLTSALDKRAGEIKKRIHDAEKLRDEAQALLAQYKRKQKEAEQEAQQIVKAAQDQADHMRQKAAADLEVTIARREKAAMEKIAQAEAKALQEVRSLAVDVAIAATRNLLDTKMTDKVAADLVEGAIADLPGKLH